MKLSKLHLVLILSVLTVTARACDLCGCYSCPLDSKSSILSAQKPFTLYGGVAEQFTHFGTDRVNGHEVANPTGEYFDSSITQVVFGASFFDSRFSIQANVPIIYRSFQRPKGFAIDRGSVSGLGDMTVSANFVVLRKEALFRDGAAGLSKDGKSAIPVRGEPDFSATVSVSAGLKLPTGDSSRLGEPEVEVEGAPASGIGGHDLTLGTGSVDAIFGVQALVRYKEVFFQADAQFAWRGTGSFDYRFANDLTWSGGPGVYFVRHDGRSLALQFALSGETKGYDHQNGEPATDTGVTSLYLGPRILAAMGRFTGEAGVDIPVIMNTTDFQTTPTYRIRAGLTYRF